MAELEAASRAAAAEEAAAERDELKETLKVAMERITALEARRAAGRAAGGQVGWAAGGGVQECRPEDTRTATPPTHGMGGTILPQLLGGCY